LKSTISPVSSQHPDNLEGGERQGHRPRRRTRMPRQPTAHRKHPVV
jgi:hypothetical protein